MQNIAPVLDSTISFPALFAIDFLSSGESKSSSIRHRTVGLKSFTWGMGEDSKLQLSLQCFRSPGVMATKLSLKLISPAKAQQEKHLFEVLTY